MENLMRETIRHIREIGGWVKQEYRKLDIEVKGFANFVTNIDLEVQNRLFDKLHALSPESVFISEENEYNEYQSDQSCWIVDPIDGTTNLIHGYPHFAISVAMVGQSSRFGIVYNPLNEELFYALSGHGAYRNEEQIRVSPHNAMDQCIVGFGLPYDRNRARTMFQTAEKIYETCQDMKRKGSAALDLAYVAAGRLDAYYEVNLNIWDFAAGAIILEEAGGTVTDWDGNRITWDRSSLDLASSNGHIHRKLLELIQSASN